MDYKAIVNQLCNYPKGILAADEKISTIEKRFKKIGVENTPENRFAYRDLLFGTQGLEEYVSGVITFNETFDSKFDDGSLLIDKLLKKGILVGVKLDVGLSDLNELEQVCNLLPDLEEQVRYYASKGATFAKWRATFRVTETTPTDEAIEKNAQILADYAKKCLDNGLVPIVEPEVLGDGDYSLQQGSKAVVKVMKVVFDKLLEKEINLNEIILKPSFVRAGFDRVYSYIEVAENTLKVFKECIPENLGGIAFLSGGMTPDEGLTTLVELNRLKYKSNFAVPVTFSYGRAIQASVLEAWNGKPENIDVARQELIKVVSRFS